MSLAMAATVIADKSLTLEISGSAPTLLICDCPEKTIPQFTTTGESK